MAGQNANTERDFDNVAKLGKLSRPMEVASAFRSDLLHAPQKREAFRRAGCEATASEARRPQGPAKARKSTEGQEDQAQPKPSRQSRRMNAADYTRFSPLALHDEPVALFCRGEKTLNRPRVRFERALRNRVSLMWKRLDPVATHSPLSRKTFRNTHSTPSAADSEFSSSCVVSS